MPLTDDLGLTAGDGSDQGAAGGGAQGGGEDPRYEIPFSTDPTRMPQMEGQYLHTGDINGRYTNIPEGRMGEPSAAPQRNRFFEPPPPSASGRQRATAPPTGIKEDPEPRRTLINLDRLINMPNPVPPFLGCDEKGEPTGPTALYWINSIENYFDTEQVPEQIQVKEAHRFISKENGNAWRILNYDEKLMTRVTDWRVFKAKFLEYFGEAWTAKPIEAGWRAIHTEWREDETFLEFRGRATRNVHGAIRAYEHRAGKTVPDWVEDYFLALVTSYSMGQTEGSKFCRKFDPAKPVSEQIAKIKEDFPRMSRRKKVDRTTKAVNVTFKKEKQESPRTEAKPSHKPSGGNEAHRADSDIVCYNCEGRNHFARSCKSKSYCGWCKQTGHQRGHGKHPCKGKGLAPQHTRNYSKNRYEEKGARPKKQEATVKVGKVENLVRSLMTTLLTDSDEQDNQQDFRNQGAKNTGQE